jgi:hypothetical protein
LRRVFSLTKNQVNSLHTTIEFWKQVIPKRTGTFCLFAIFGFLGLRILMADGPSVGQLAPEISGKIQDGSKVRLSDFRKKVVFLDFWGDW